MINKVIYRKGKDNIFDFPFMDDFTTVAILKEDGKDISHLNYTDEDDFYSFSEDKSYTTQELFAKFNIKEV